MTLKRHFSGEEHFEPPGAPCTWSSVSFSLGKDRLFPIHFCVDWTFCRCWDAHRLSTGRVLCCDCLCLCRSGKNQQRFNRRWSLQLRRPEVLGVGSSGWKKGVFTQGWNWWEVDGFSQTIVCVFSPQTEGSILPAALPQHIFCSECCAMPSSAFGEAGKCWGDCRDLAALVSCPWTRLHPAVLLPGTQLLLFILGAPSSALGRRIRRGASKKQLLALQSCSFWSLHPAVWSHLLPLMQGSSFPKFSCTGYQNKTSTYFVNDIGVNPLKQSFLFTSTPLNYMLH